jgi:hypothetical protein
MHDGQLECLASSGLDYLREFVDFLGLLLLRPSFAFATAYGFFALPLRFIFFTVLSNFCLLTPFFTPRAIPTFTKYCILKELNI